ncbi:MAG: hypothetical protein MJ227_04795 [Bacilli bacterium]|nr:hypothetical protein [Bacilli bacterium]
MYESHDVKLNRFLLFEYDRFIFRFLIDRAEITPERNITFNFVDGSSEIYFCPSKPKYARK